MREDKPLTEQDRCIRGISHIPCYDVEKVQSAKRGVLKEIDDND